MHSGRETWPCVLASAPFSTDLPVTSIVSKGSRDELLVLSNGGRIHIQSNFSLNEEEKARIAALVSAKRQLAVLPGTNLAVWW